MNELTQKNLTVSMNNETFCNNNVMEVALTVNYIADTIDEIYKVMGNNLPACLYRLKLHNELLKRGFDLQANKKVAGHCSEDRIERNLLVVNNSLAIEYISTDCITDFHKQLICHDLISHNYEMGMLINVSKSNDVFEIITVNKSNLTH